MKNLRYIGPFFRMNSLSEKEINGQLFYFSKEAVRTIVLQSKCGLVSPIKKYNKSTSSIDITTNSNLSPLLCVYRKSAPNFIHSKNSNGFDEDSFKKEINPATNALMTLSILELLDYYRSFENIDSSLYSIYSIYKNLSKDQLDFYSLNLRNAEGVFIDKKNLLENNSKNFNLVDKDKKFKFSDQAFMMIAYYLYADKNPDDAVAESYKNFSGEILKMFCDYKESIYDGSFDETCKILLAFNILYEYEKSDELLDLIVDLSDYVMSRFDEKDYYVDSLDTASLCSLILTLSYKHTKILTFSEKSTEIINRLYTLYDEDKGTFYKLSSKKELKYSCSDITFYLLAFIVYSDVFNTSSEYRGMISSIYKKFVVNSGLIPSWPDAPTLDDYERYRGFTLNSKDMLDESYFRMPNIPSPDNSGIAPIFNKSITYNKKKDSFSTSKVTFDSYKNFLNFFLFIHLFKNDYLNEMGLFKDHKSENKSDEQSPIATSNELEVKAPEQMEAVEVKATEEEIISSEANVEDRFFRRPLNSISNNNEVEILDVEFSVDSKKITTKESSSKDETYEDTDSSNS